MTCERPVPGRSPVCQFGRGLQAAIAGRAARGCEKVPSVLEKRNNIFASH